MPALSWAKLPVLTIHRFGAAAKEHGKLFYNDAGFFLAMAIADDALFGHTSLEDVQKQEIPANENELVLRFKDSSLKQPVLRRYTKAGGEGGITNEPMPKSAFTDILKSTLTNAGYLSGPSIHAIRRQLGKSVGSKFPHALQRFHETGKLLTVPMISTLAFAWSCC
jgi:Protein of unknown function (DUF3435)